MGLGFIDLQLPLWQFSHRSDYKRAEEMARPATAVPYLRQWREARGLSLSQMSRRTGISKSALSRAETGKAPYSGQLLERYAQVIGVQPYTFLHRPPGGADELFAIIDDMLRDDRRDDLRRLEQLTKIFLKS